MVIVDEKDAPFRIPDPPEARVLKCLLSPALHPEVTGIGVGITILPAASRSDYIGHEEGEMFYVVSGCGKFKVEDRVYELKPGILIWTSPQERHQMINDSDTTLKILWVLSPPGKEREILKAAEAR
jgi:mannose-6-phosphate isomerase-like protein (cupin superfamily)